MPGRSHVRHAFCLLLGLYGIAAVAQAAALDFAALQSLLEHNDIRSVQGLIAALPPALRNRYALVFESRSLQGASLANPRAILFGPDARFIVTFNGDPAQSGFEVLETMEFDDQSKEFRLRELRFPEGAAGAGRVVMSEVNPQRCARCHGTPPHPLWDSFPLWPGAYGERYHANLSERERAGLSTFLTQQPSHPRYRLLLGAARLADADTFRSSALAQYAGVPREPPNAELSVYLSRLQSQAIARQLARLPAFEQYQYALLGVADSSCGALADFYPDELWRHQRHAFEQFARDTALANARESQLKAARAHSGAARAQASATRDNSLLQLRFVAESALGAATQDWTMALERSTYDFTVPPLFMQPLRETLLAEVAAHDGLITDLSTYSTSTDGDRYCSYLKRRSRAALSTGDAGSRGAANSAPTDADAGASLSLSPGTSTTTTAASLARPAALQLCASCHERGIAPALPFSDPTRLAQQLRARPSAHGALLDEIRFRLAPEAGAQHMPLGVNLSDADRHNLEAYFAALATFSK